jgi:adenine deaminase
MHCDVNQQNTLVHIAQCIDDIDVDRIDHGVNSLEDPILMAKIRDKKLGLTVCPVSNRFVVQSLTANEIRRMLDNDMLVTINSDDPAYFRAYLNENLIELQNEGQFSKQDITTLVRNAFQVAWLPDAQKQAYLSALNNFVNNNGD